MSPSVLRYLRATRGTVEVLESPVVYDSLASDVARAFPFAIPSFNILPIRSASWKSEYVRPSSGDATIVLDESLTDILRLLAALLEVNPFHPGVTLAAVHPLLADACFFEGNIDHAIFFANRGLERLRQTKSLTSWAFNKESGEDHRRFMLLHESVHGMLLSRVPEVYEWAEVVRDAVEQQAALNEKFAQLGPQAMGFEHLTGLNWDEIDQQTIQTQCHAYASELRASTSITEEVTCDILAIMGYANAVMPESLLLRGAHRALSERQSIDMAVSFLQAIRTLKLQQYLAGLVQGCKNICLRAAAERIDEGLFGSTARANILVHVTMSLLGGCVTAGVTQEFHRQISLLFKRLSERLLTPTESFFELVDDLVAERNVGGVPAEYREIRSQYPF